MPAREIEAVYHINSGGTGYDNRIELLLSSNGTVQADLSAVTRWVMYIGSVTVDSAVTAGAFTLVEDSQGRDVLTINLEGKFTEPDDGTGVYASLISYDAVNTDGVVWISKNQLTGKTRLKIRVVQEAAV